MNLDFNSTAQLLISGGDERLALNAYGVNKYGCAPAPDDTLLSFSSSTASTISSESFAIADALRSRLACEFETTSSKQIYVQEVMRQKNEWRELIGLAAETRLIFSPSGTDVHALIANQVAPNTLIIMVEGNETGSGVSAALEQGNGVEVVTIPLRLFDGLPRLIEEIDTEIISHVERGISQQRDVLLILVDQSKTGMIAPSPHCAVQLKTKYAEQLNVLVDACQFRFSAITLNAYLQQGFMVAVTGSKFLAAPSFSAILLLPAGLNAFANVLEEPINWGLLLRMEVALVEYRAFCILTDLQISTVMNDFSVAVQNYLTASPYFESLSVPALNRGDLIKTANWDNLPTIFPFVLYRDNKPLSRSETLACYQYLPLQNPRCQIGQPVACGQRDNVEISALRLCLSSRLIVDAARSEQHRQMCIQNALRVLATLETLVG